MAESFIGKPIALISQSDVRYRGILSGIDPAASTIKLSNVYSMGTESRRPATEFIPPNQVPYNYIIFKAAEVKDLHVDSEPMPVRNVHDDPAVVGASIQSSPGYGQYAAAQPYPQAAAAAATQQMQQAAVYQQQQVAAARAQAAAQTRRPNPVHNANASMETVERAIGDLRSPGAENGGGRGARRGPKPELTVPNTDFDFQQSNAKFDKAGLAPKKPGGDDVEDGEEPESAKEPAAYNPQKSFFDSLSSAPAGPGPRGGGGGPRRGGGGPGRNRREEERERNFATFGEAGGIGLMGPGAYVGGWGGHGRRGGRPRRGGYGGAQTMSTR